MAGRGDEQRQSQAALTVQDLTKHNLRFPPRNTADYICWGSFVEQDRTGNPCPRATRGSATHDKEDEAPHRVQERIAVHALHLNAPGRQHHPLSLLPDVRMSKRNLQLQAAPAHIYRMSRLLTALAIDMKAVPSEDRHLAGDGGAHAWLAGPGRRTAPHSWRAGPWVKHFSEQSEHAAPSLDTGTESRPRLGPGPRVKVPGSRYPGGRPRA